MTDTNPVHIISDSPKEDSEYFGFDVYAKTIAELIAYRENKTPIVIGIYGPWGSGKTTLMKTVISHLERIEKYQDKSPYRNCKTVWFQPWKYKEEDEILSALIEEIFRAMKEDCFFENFKAQIEVLVKRFNKLKAFGKIIKNVSRLDISELFSELPYKQKLGFYDTFQKFFDRLLWTYLKWRPQINAEEKPDDKEGVLVVFIDDLDRCPEGRILKVLETIKLFMDNKCCVFVIGAAQEIIQKALKKYYDEEDVLQFMEKIVQVTFNLPQISSNDIRSYLEKIKEIEKINPDLIKEDNTPHLEAIISAMNNNPRRLNWFLNNLALLQGLIINKGINIDFKHLMYWSIIQLCYPSLEKMLKKDPNKISLLRENIQKIDNKIDDKENWDISDVLLKEVPPSLHTYLNQKELVKILRNFDITPDQLRQLIVFSGVVKTVEKAKEKEEKVDFNKMVEVESGKFLYEDDKYEENVESSFFIDIYPVTNSQYSEFIKADGYSNDEYWIKEGKEWKERNKITQPRFWNDEEWNQPDYPVVGVSYFEADAYARWAGKMLPTEKQWEKAARWTDGRKYPWGNEFDKEKCNTRESGIGRTTSVIRYPNGVTPYGCYDMAGNVWEWTDSWHDDKEKKYKVVRGGSWSYSLVGARCAFRIGGNPGSRVNYVGFRCVRTK